MLRSQKKHRTRLAGVIAGLVVVINVACASADSTATPTLQPTRSAEATTTPIPAEVARALVGDLFRMQVDAIKRGDWEAVYGTCSPQFRAARAPQRFIQDAMTQFARNGYTAEGFEARDIQPFLRASDRVRVRWDAYQDGRYIRTVEIGQTYIFTQGRWFDDGAWCR